MYFAGEREISNWFLDTLKALPTLQHSLSWSQRLLGGGYTKRGRLKISPHSCKIVQRCADGSNPAKHVVTRVMHPKYRRRVCCCCCLGAVFTRHSACQQGGICTGELDLWRWRRTRCPPRADGAFRVWSRDGLGLEPAHSGGARIARLWSHFSFFKQKLCSKIPCH